MAPRYTSPLMQFFGYAHLPEHLQEISKPFAQLAEKVDRRMAHALDAWVFKRSAELGMHTDALVLMAHDLPDNLRAALHQSELALQRLVDAKDAAVRVLVVLPKPEPVKEPNPDQHIGGPVIINSTAGIFFTGDEVTYEAIVTAAGMEAALTSKRLPVVKYKEGGSLSEIGYLRPGQKLAIRAGMVFNVGADTPPGPPDPPPAPPGRRVG